MRFALWIVCLFVLITCGKKENSSSSPPPPPPPTSPDDSPETVAPTEKPERRGSLGIVVKALPDPNRYFVVLDWRGGLANVSHWQLKRVDDKGTSPVELLKAEEKTRDFKDETVKPGESYRYTLIAEKDGNSQEAGTANVTIPRDLEIKGRVTQSQIENAKPNGRLFLRGNTRISILENPLKIQVEELFSEKAIIETFSASAHPNSHGKNGGTIFIQAKQAHGFLKILANGQNGSHGTNGERGSDGWPGASGRDAVVGWRKEPPIPVPLLPTIEVPFCESEPTNGIDGESGHPGEGGHSGGKGGDSSSLEIRIEDASDFQLDFKNEPGLGGHGGDGGSGGRGGAGGGPGNRGVFNVCSQASPGRWGANGAYGPKGSDGASGKIAFLCIQLGKEIRGNCKP